MKSVIITQTNPGRLANQLWNYACVYAYCLERGYDCKNPSFFRYAEYFENIHLEGFGKFYAFVRAPKLFSIIYALYVRFVDPLHSRKIIRADKEFLLPPSENIDEEQNDILKCAEANDVLYLKGWLFRNPIGLKKFHKEIATHFMPKQEFRGRAEFLLTEARKKYEHCVGVHVRHGDYKVWQGGAHYVSFEQAYEFIKKYLKNKGYDAQKTVFIVCSDDPIDEKVFSALNIFKGPGTPIEDLYALSLADEIIGSHSTYGPWAAYIAGSTFIEFVNI